MGFWIYVLMILKYKPQDFIVQEVYDLELLSLKIKKDTRKFYYYFLLTKTNYEQILAIKKIANIFRKKIKDITFCGRKDKDAITTQLICIQNAKRILIDRNVDFINDNVENMEIKYLGEFPSKLYIGDNTKNNFNIILRKMSIKNNNAQVYENKYFLNFFGKQRFGFANTSHIIGKYILQNDFKNAIYCILCSKSDNSSNQYLDSFINHIVTQKIDNKENIDKAIDLCPNILNNIKPILYYLQTNIQDYKGAFCVLSNKEKSFFISAYQSYIFNQSIQKFTFQYDDMLSLVCENENENENKHINEYENELLLKDKITRDNFKSLKEINIEFKSHKRDVYTKVSKLSYQILDDEHFEGFQKVILDFSLNSGSYATNVIEQLSTENAWGN